MESVVVDMMDEIVVGLDDIYCDELNNQIFVYMISNGIDSEDVGYVVKDLVTGETSSFNEDEKFVAASTYKLPLAMYWYDLVNANEVSLDDTYTFLSEYYYGGGNLDAYYSIGSEVKLETLLNWMILYSDNSASHMLYGYLGGYSNYKELIKKYSNREYSEDFTSEENVQTASYMSDVISYLYENKEEYSDLITNMYYSQPDNYLNDTIQVGAIQKYGWYGSSVCAVGYVYASHDYSVAIYTNLGVDGNEHIGNINEICYYYFNSI